MEENWGRRKNGSGKERENDRDRVRRKDGMLTVRAWRIVLAHLGRRPRVVWEVVGSVGLKIELVRERYLLVVMVRRETGVVMRSRGRREMAWRRLGKVVGGSQGEVLEGLLEGRIRGGCGGRTGRERWLGQRRRY